MNIKRAAGVGILLWLLIFVWWSIMMFIPVLGDKQNLQWLIHYILLVPATIFGARLYYQNRDKTNGFLVGLAFLVPGVILDILITALIFVGYAEYFSNPRLYLGYAIMIGTVGVYRNLKKS